ncbi:hypothetical protein [Dysgonomonas capnocytophagoides]|uniref:hypothetical protein n=1 Tax=Dysgonomonas capnocytophagoides TaxID=45254 RepID=UPI0029256036|nr:hypothetical protein DCPSUM001_33850 [Dysgonomonas capnocytophagoides]
MAVFEKMRESAIRINEAIRNGTLKDRPDLKAQLAAPVIIDNPSQKLLRFVRYLEIKNMRSRAELKRNRDKYFPNTE